MGKCDLSVELDESQFPLRAGGKVSGRVKLVVPQKGGDSNASRLELKVTGLEIAEVHYTTTTSTGNSTTTHHHTAKASRVLMSFCGDLAHYGDDATPEQQQQLLQNTPAAELSPGAELFYPFEIALPPDLPSSLHVDGSYTSKCAISYMVMARLYRKGMLNRDVKANAVFPVVMVAREGEKQDASSPKLVGPDTQRVGCCGCNYRGSMSLATAADRVLLSPGHAVEVKTAVKNDSVVEVQHISVNLIRHAHWEAEGHRESCREILDSFQVAGAASKCDAAKRTVKHRKSQLSSVASEASSHLFSALNDDRGGAACDTCRLCVPDVAFHSYEGPLLRVGYTIEVTVKTPRCISDPKLAIPLCIHPDIEATSTGGGSFSSSADVRQESEKTRKGSLVAGMQDIRVGGRATTGAESPVPASPVPVRGANLGIRSLIDELDSVSINQVRSIETFVNEASNLDTLRKITPQEFTEIVTHVRFSLDQPRAAALLGGAIPEGITCAFIVGILQALPDHSMGRVDVIKAVLQSSQVSDLSTRSGDIREQLTDFELMQVRNLLK
jgi:hypothetical protein